ncbi:nicotinic acid mononucleotide adenylyltransferase [Acuticoccus sediminis]|uniref:Probable nicotinate-nucleotide adenylyltransferase n=1 Tax=Acuticoccus sediminis TaxID=2184697 RepID=A0A8B2NR31_9HYPH|nr:nicotinate-nucleotide adenylyltransferase [Acuticoccus sediminis]RAI00770.1 nicotinic acid mononucleotide adenylyltransferase [Acuticoccus sediminis]
MSVAPFYLRPPRVGFAQRIALFGGSFNPPHGGHRAVADAALRRLGVDRVWWMVTPGNPLKSTKELLPLAERIRLTEAIADHPRMTVTAFEAAAGIRYSADAILYLKRRFPAVRFIWLMGADNLATLHRWQEWKLIMRSVPVAVVDRPGASLAAISSTAARAFASARRPESQAGALARATPPAWVFLHAPLNSASSTALRALGR